jgi:transaldolase/glucose-6-phosphate isomerase
MNGIEDAVALRRAAFEAEDVVARIWRVDHTVWAPDPTEIADRLGWLRVAEVMRPRIGELRAFAKGCAGDGLTHTVLAGMGGSSLAPEVFRTSFGIADGMLDLAVLDTTNPDQIAAVEGGLDLDHTLFVVSSKSGTTIETDSHLRYFWERVPDGRRFVAVTDPGTPLEALARERGFRGVFANPRDIGGRYSALSYFGLVPAALIGAPLEDLLDGALQMAAACRAEAGSRANPGLELGLTVGEAARAGVDKLTFVLPPRIDALAVWLEQLIAESTGKLGTGVVPVADEPLGGPDVYGGDRLFVAVGDAGAPELAALDQADHPVLRLPDAGATDLGREMFRWEFATAVIGAVLGINPYDQPDVQSAKDATARVLEDASRERPDPGDASSFMDGVAAPDYVAIQAYVPRDASHRQRLEAARLRIRDGHDVATTLGFGPRFLHSTGQLHKGGPNTVVAIQVVEPPHTDLPIPGRDFTFGRLLAAQADGDLAALRQRDRRVVRVDLDGLDGLARRST